MPYTIRKQKCKQSDGDSGGYTLSYTDNKGKKHRACHTSRKKARGQIAAIEGPREGYLPYSENMTQKSFLREVIQAVLLEVTQSDLNSNKILGYAAEWATWEALTGTSGFEIAVEEDPRINDKYAASSQDEKDLYQLMYEKMVSVARIEVDKIRSDPDKGLSMSNARRPDMGTTTEKVDVWTSDADVHVKFNDPNRLAGFQRAHGEVESSRTTVIFDSVIKDFVGTLDIDSRFLDSRGVLRRPAGVKGMSTMGPAQKKKAASLLSDFASVRDQYRLSFTNSEKNRESPGYRSEFMDMLEDRGIKEAIIDDISDQLMGNTGRPAIYFKYFTAGTSVTLDTHEYGILDLVVTRNSGESTKFYKVTNSTGDKIYFYVEFRLDGGGHPPQLKVGPDLDV